MHILITSTAKYEPTGWSAGYCPHCQQLEAVELANVIREIAIWFIPIESNVIGQAGRCDFCERPMQNVLTAEGIPLSEWSRADGLTILIERLKLPSIVEISDSSTESRLHSLLSAVEVASSLNNVDITFGIVPGAFIGALIAVPLALYIFYKNLLQIRGDLFGMVFISIMIGAVVGGVMGAIVYALLKRSKVAFKKIDNACTKYQVDTRRLAELSRGYGRVVQQAAQAVYDRTGYGRCNAPASRYTPSTHENPYKSPESGNS